MVVWQAFIEPCTVVTICGVFGFCSSLDYKTLTSSDFTVEAIDNAGFPNGVLCLQITSASGAFIELQEATNGFKNRIGRGAFGTVYSGVLTLDDEVVYVAVKQLEKMIEQGEKEFLTEAMITDWTLNCVKAGSLQDMVSYDSEIVSDFKRFGRTVVVGLWCICPKPNFRPSMKKTMETLEGSVEVGVPSMIEAQIPLRSSLGLWQYLEKEIIKLTSHMVLAFLLDVRV
ncbi:Serine-threonine/tyrosine-protein kinase, catalytic domain [Dillenia turbinata]|uniref:Serine-threonine/tyrosine-protein kinase, catalytic domain n=1 Tax=Dillenia turbinata TaxID=194707 RepID=A0AAN8VHE4_9MAGN